MILPVTIDLCKPQELAFVEDSYIHTNKQHYRGKGVPEDGLNVWLRKRFRDDLERGTVLVACEDGYCLGWAMFEPRGSSLCITGLYTKHMYRRMGVASQLIQAATTLVKSDELCYDCVCFRAGKRCAEKFGARRCV